VGGETLKDAMQTGFSFVQIGEFSFIIASLGSKLGVTDPAIYPIIVAASVLTTFLTPYIMKATLPCYNFLYNHASPRVKAKIDAREKQVADAEIAEVAAKAKAANMPSTADKVRRSVRKTLITKHVLDLFLKNMSENDQPADQPEEK
jgi:CPA2 family monovalent cation:H+ antiporter-2